MLFRSGWTREEAAALCEDLLEPNLAPSMWDATIRDKVAERIRPAAVAESESITGGTPTQQGLQRHADLAMTTGSETSKAKKVVAENGQVPADTPVSGKLNTIRLLQAGYLNEVVQA